MLKYPSSIWDIPDLRPTHPEGSFTFDFFEESQIYSNPINDLPLVWRFQSNHGKYLLHRGALYIKLNIKLHIKLNIKLHIKLNIKCG